MMKIETFFEDPYDDVRITDDRMEDYTIDNIAKMESNNEDHSLDTPITETKKALDIFQKKKASKSETFSEQTSSTLTVDILEDQFVDLVKRTVGTVISKYPKGSPVYKEFFTKPLKYYTKPKRALVPQHIDHFLARLKAHSEFGTEPIEAFNTIKENFEPARDIQQHKIGDVKSLITATSVERKALNLQVFDNQLVIARKYKDKPEYARVFFDTSKLFPHTKSHDLVIGDDDFSVKLAAHETKNSGLTNIIGKKARFVSLNGGRVKIYTVASLDNLTQSPQSITMEADGDLTISMTELGNPANPFLIISNQSDEETEIIIEWVD